MLNCSGGLEMDRIAFIIADDKNLPLANNLVNSIRKFHDEEELPIHIVTGDELKEYLKNDPHFFYRATPVVARKFKDYDLVIKLDADQICFGGLSYIFEQSYDVGTVLNINRVDPPKYGFVSIQGVTPAQYYNCGLVAMRSKDFIEHWHKVCMSDNFFGFQYREQDLLNVLCHFGTYNVKCFDNYDGIYEYMAWHGLVAKGECANAYLTEDKQVMIPIGTDNYPDMVTALKMFHFAGGGNEPRNFRIWFNDAVQKHIEWLIKN